MKKEEFFISGFSSEFIGDDGAFIDGFVYSKDLFCEGVHFKRDWMSLYQVARKSMLINISDAIVMNAKPKYALIGIALPEDITLEQMRELSNGFKDISKEYNLKIIGGDTVAGDRLNISITIISKSKSPIFRKGMKAGDYIAYSGDLGSVKKDLNRLLRGSRVNKNSKFILPSLSGEFFYDLSKYITTSLDISDGLSKDLSRLCEINGMGVKFLKKIQKDILCSGEEYEILFSFNKRYLSKILSIAKKHRVKIRIFARSIRGRYKSVCKENHF